MATPHALGQEEAIRRLKEKFEAIRTAYHAQVSELREQWQENTLSFAFKAVGMKIAGTVTVGASEVLLAADLPLKAVVLKGLIERQIRAELGTLLA
jgi:hypothetical protein